MGIKVKPLDSMEVCRVSSVYEMTTCLCKCALCFGLFSLVFVAHGFWLFCMGESSSRSVLVRRFLLVGVRVSV